MSGHKDLIIEHDEEGYIHAKELVRCKDCKHLEHMYALDDVNNKKCYICRKHSFTGLREPDWFCADGERK